MTLIEDIYDKIGIILRDMLAERGPFTLFTTDELYLLYLQRYPEDEGFVEARSNATLKMYVPGMVWEYSRKDFGSNPDKPAIQYLGPHKYRFV